MMSNNTTEKMNKLKTIRSISVILVISLIFTSVFISHETNSVSADTINQPNSELQQVEDLTLVPDSGAKYDGYIVKIEDGKEGKVDEDTVREYESTSENEYVVVDEPADSMGFIDPEYVEYIEPNYLRYPVNEGSSALSEPITTFAYNGANSSQYNLIKLPSAWDLGFSGKGSEIVVFDSGLNISNTHLSQSSIRKTYNFVNSYNNRGAFTLDVRDGLGHGSFVSGLIIASSPAIKGVSYASSMNSYKIIGDNGYGSVADFIVAMDHLIYKSGLNPDVINMSFGGPDYSVSERNYIKTLTGKGSIVIAAAGNDGEKGSPYSYPANYPDVIGVGSVNTAGGVSDFSTKNSSVAVVAPGEYLSSFARSGYSGLTAPSAYNCGTSYSSPIVAGAVALLDQDGFPGITRNKFLTLIKNTSSNRTSPNIHSGYGIINIGEMARIVKSGNSIADSFKLAYEPGSQKLSGTINTIHTYGQSTPLPTKNNISKSGYYLSHWVDQNGIKRTSIPYNYRGDLTLTPGWSPNKYKLKFKGNGGKVKVSSKTVSYYQPVGTLKTPKKRSRYNFLGWYTKKSGGSQYYKGMKYKRTGDRTLYARWTKKKVVRFNANKGIVKKYAKTIKRGRKYGTLPKPTRSGYSFKGWFTKKKGGKKITKNSTVTKSSSFTVYARWKKK